jgi:hypothetical protein
MIRESLSDVRFWADEYLERWAVAHQDHPIFEGAGGLELWYYGLALRRANLEIACAEYANERKFFEIWTWKDNGNETSAWHKTKIKIKE